MYRILSRQILSTSAALALAGCMVGPHYHKPTEAPVAPTTVDPNFLSDAAYDPAWWRSYQDPVLDTLIDKGLSGNLDVKIAVDRVNEARALFNDSKRDLFPRVTAEGSYTRSDEQIAGFGTNRVNIQSADIGFDARWEIDLFGRVRHEIESARAETQANAEDLHAVRISVTAEIARNYLTLRGVQAQRAITEQNTQMARDTLRLTQLRDHVGSGDPIDTQSALARLNATEARIPALTTAEQQTINRIAVLLGVRPSDLDTDLASLKAPPAPRATPLPIGDASDFLRNRPDVRAAERRLAAETARTGVATADLFPRLNVLGFVGLLSGNVTSLFSNGSKAFSVTPSVSWPAFDLGGARARLRAQEARGDVAQAQYDRSVLSAIEDLQDSLVAYRERQSEVASLAEAANAARKAADLAHIRYKEGSIDFLRVLDAERTRLEAENALVQSQTAANTDVASVYKALGGA